jgi:hypothetical protein
VPDTVVTRRPPEPERPAPVAEPRPGGIGGGTFGTPFGTGNGEHGAAADDDEEELPTAVGGEDEDELGSHEEE